MNQKHMGWIIGIAGLGMMLHLLSGDIASLNSWHDAMYPAFMSGIIEHISAVLIAFTGGNLVPNLFKSNEDKVSESKINEINKAGV